jgi:hypothetical protein
VNTIQLNVTIPTLQYNLRQILDTERDTVAEKINRALAQLQESGELEKFLTQEVDRALKEVLRAEVQDYFRFGKGRVSVRQAVWASLEEMFSEKGEDNAG